MCSLAQHMLSIHKDKGGSPDTAGRQNWGWTIQARLLDPHLPQKVWIVILAGMPASTPSPQAVFFLPSDSNYCLQHLIHHWQQWRICSPRHVDPLTQGLVLSALRLDPVWGNQSRAWIQTLSTCSTQAYTTCCYMHAPHHGGFQNRRMWGILGTVKRVSKKIL